jgi:hypothetical protein
MGIVVEREREREREGEREREKKKRNERTREKKRCSRFFYVCMLTFSALTPISISQKSVNTHTHAR